MHKITIAHSEIFLMYVLDPFRTTDPMHWVIQTNLALDLFYMRYSSYANTMNYLD